MAKSNPVVSDPRRLDIHVVQDALRSGKGSDRWLAGFLPSAYAAPERFWEALYAYAASTRPGQPRSRIGEAYDLYYDCVAAHLTRRRAAIVTREREGEDFRETAFESLHARASALAAVWARAGVGPKKAVCIVLPVGLDYAVCALAALRLGAILASLPPEGATYVRTRILALAPDYVVTNGHHRSLVREFESILLPSSPAGAQSGSATGSIATSAGLMGTHVYAAADIALRLLSPFGLEAGTPVEVTAAALHASLLRDGLLVYGLDGNDTVAAPGFDSLQFQPHLLLTSLMAGATYAAIAMNDVEAEPSITARLRISVLGIGRAFREIVLAAPTFAPCERAWFRSLTDVLDTDRWDELGRHLAEKKLLAFNVLTNAASAGAHLFSPRSSAPPGLRVWPVPGVTWQLSEVAGGTLPALNDSGVYTSMIEGKADASLPRVIMARSGDGYVYAGTMDLGPDAQVYPAVEVASIVERHPGVRHAAVIIAPGGAINEAKPVLLIFVDPVSKEGVSKERASKEGDPSVSPIRIDAVNKLVAREMGGRFEPYRVEVFPLRPRLLEGVVDRAWCRSQYLAGAFTQKSRMDLFVTLAELGYIFADATSEE